MADIAPSQSFLAVSHPLPFHQFDPAEMIPTIEFLLEQARADLKRIEDDTSINYESILGALDRLAQIRCR